MEWELLGTQLWRDHDLDRDLDGSQDRPCLGPQEHPPLPSRPGCSGLSVLPQALRCARLRVLGLCPLSPLTLTPAPQPPPTGRSAPGSWTELLSMQLLRGQPHRGTASGPPKLFPAGSAIPKGRDPARLVPLGHWGGTRYGTWKCCLPGRTPPASNRTQTPLSLLGWKDLGPSCSTIFNREFPSIPKGWMPGSRELWLRNEFTCTTEFFLAICRGSEKPLSTAPRFRIKPLASLPCLSPRAKSSAGAGRVTHMERGRQAGLISQVVSSTCALQCLQQTRPCGRHRKHRLPRVQGQDPQGVARRVSRG